MAVFYFSLDHYSLNRSLLAIPIVGGLFLRFSDLRKSGLENNYFNLHGLIRIKHAICRFSLVAFFVQTCVLISATLDFCAHYGLRHVVYDRLDTIVD